MKLNSSNIVTLITAWSITLITWPVFVLLSKLIPALESINFTFLGMTFASISDLGYFLFLVFVPIAAFLSGIILTLALTKRSQKNKTLLIVIGVVVSALASFLAYVVAMLLGFFLVLAFFESGPLY